MPNPILLVPLDGSTHSEHAIPAAIGLARRIDARLELLRVRPPRSIREEAESRPFTDPGPPSAERRYLDELVTRLSGAVPVDVKVLRGDPIDAIVNRAGAIGASAIVMSTRARAGASRLLLGSVAAGVVQTAAVPVMLVRQAPTPVTLPSARSFPRVLIPVDGSPHCEQMVPLLLQTIGAQDTTVTLVRVIHPEAALVPAGGGRDRAHDPKEGLDGLAGRLRGEGVNVDSRILTGGDAAEAILEEAGTTGARLIAMTTRARTGASRIVIGSVAEEVLRGASCPVLLFRPWG